MHLQKWIRRTALLLILVLAAAPFAYADYAAYVSSGSMGVYSDSGLGKKIGTLPKNTVVVVRSSAGGVAKIACRGKTGYAAASDLNAVGGDAAEAVVGKATRVYEKPSTGSRSAPIKKGTQVTLLATSGGCAMVELAGYIGYVNKDDLLKPGESAEEPEETETPTDNYVVESFRATVTADSLVVYKGASSSSKKLATLQRGAAVSVRAYDDTWACLENNGKYGFSLRSGLERADDEPAPTPTPAPTPEPTPKPTPTPTAKPSGSTQDAIDSGKYSNEEIIFLFLTKEMGLNAAAACGILSNVKSESSFRPTAYNAGGNSYGICQWTGGRYTRLKNYCAGKGYDYTTLLAQLYFLEYELKNHYTKTLSYMRGVENSAAGAYDAGHYWCYNFEVPANRASVSVKRGNTARDTYWPKYT